MESEIKSLLTSNDLYDKKMEEVFWSLVAIANAQKRDLNKVFENGTWKTVQSIVRLGLAKQFFKVGDQLQCTHEVYGTGEQKLLTWDIIGIDYDIPVDENGNEIIVKDSAGNDINAHSLTLQTHDCIISTNKSSGQAANKNYWDNTYTKKWLNTNDFIYEYDTRKGFLYGLDDDLLEILTNVKKANIYYTGSGEEAWLTLSEEKIFLLSASEGFGLNQGGLNIPSNNLKDSSVLRSRDTEVISSKQYIEETSNNLFKMATPVGTERPIDLGWYEVKEGYEYYIPPRSSNLNPSNESDINRVKQFEGVDILQQIRSVSDSYAGVIDPTGAISYKVEDEKLGYRSFAPCCVIA